MKNHGRPTVGSAEPLVNQRYKEIDFVVFVHIYPPFTRKRIDLR